MPSSPPVEALLQYGFRSDQTFAGLSAHHPFLFRIHDSTTDTRWDVSDGFVASLYNNDQRSLHDALAQHEYMPDAEIISSADLCTAAAYHLIKIGKEGKKERQKKTPWISTSFSLAWVIWEILRREAVAHDPERTIYAIAPDVRAFLVNELVPAAVEGSRGTGDRSQSVVVAQEVLVLDVVPVSAVLSRVPWTEVNKAGALPAWFNPRTTAL